MTKILMMKVIVFPAYAGVFPRQVPATLKLIRVPRIRGGVPSSSHPVLLFAWCSPHTRGCSFSIARSRPFNWCSPHTRGCSPKTGTDLYKNVVFPAYAGVFLQSNPNPIRIRSVPRIRGGVPVYPVRWQGLRACSPHTRGCSLLY